MMFRSVSACTPNSQVTVDFVSSSSQDFYTNEPGIVKVNGVAVPSLPVQLNLGDVVSMTVTTPATYLGYKFYAYSLNNQEQYFAVVNKNLYNPTVKPTDASKKWFNYLPSVFQVSFYSRLNQTQHSLGFGREKINIPSSHVVLDHVNDAVCFYSSQSQEMIARVEIPGGPIDYRKTTYTKTDGSIDHEVIVLCNDKKLYKIRFDHQYFGSGEYQPTVIPVALPNNLPFEQDLPTGETFIEARRNRLLSKLSPLITALDIKGSQIWLAGYDSVFLLTKNFSLVSHIIIERQTIVSIACLNNDAIVTTRSGAAYYVSSSGTTTLLYSAAALGTPFSFNNGTAVALPDCNNQRLLVFTANSPSYTVWATPEFVPAYVREFDSKLWVTGHDDNRVLKFNSSNSFETYTFDNKTTVVSAVGESILGVHYLQQFITLDSLGIKKVIPFRFDSRHGPVSHIGTEPVAVKMLGQERVEVITGPRLTSWVNGINGELASTGDYIGVSYRAETLGNYRSAIVIGETAIDYDVVAVPHISVGKYFVPEVVTTSITPPYTTQAVPTVGDKNSGTTPINLGFDFSIFGNVYSTVNVSTNGYLTFGGTQTTTAATSIGSLGVDAIYIEIQDLYQGTAINNTNPLNITTTPLSSNETPGVYYKTGFFNNFNYAKIRWVGTSMSTNPLGNSVTTLATITNKNRIPVAFADLSRVNVGDYVSGTGITVSTTVTGTSAINTGSVTDITAFVSNSTTNTLYITPLLNAASLFAVLNSNFISSTVKNTDIGSVGYLQSFANVTIAASNKVLSKTTVSGIPQVVLDGNVPVQVDSTWGCQFKYIQSAQTEYTVIPIETVTVQSSSITVIETAVDDSSFYLSQADFDLVQVSQTLFNANISGGSSRVLRKVTNDPFGPRIDIFGTHALLIGDVITLDTSTLTFSSNLIPGFNNNLLEANAFVNYSLTLDSVTDLVPTQRQQSNLSISGNFIAVSTNSTITAATDLLVKTVTATVPAFTYEVNLYTNELYQFVEIFFDNPNHQFNKYSGIVSGNSFFSPVSENLAANKSAVFYSLNLTGNSWIFLGNGVVNQLNTLTQKTFRDPVIYKSVSEYDNHARIEFVIDQNLSDNDEVILSTDYGFITANNSSYTGTANISLGEVISLTVPFNKSVRPIAPMLTLGQHQFATPMVSSVGSQLTETVFLYDNQPKKTLVSGNATVSISGTYYIPSYYRTNQIYSNISVGFTRTRGNSTIALTGFYHELQPGDTVTVSNFLTSHNTYDTRDVVITGPEVLRIRWRTALGSPIFNYLNYGTLVQPYVDNVVYEVGDYNGVLSVTETLNYQTQNIALTANTTITGNLFVDMPGVVFVVNGNIATSYVTNVATGANISLYRRFYNYFQGNTIIYQVQTDSDTQSNIYIPIGHWDVNNKVITGSVIETSRESLVDLDSLLAVSSSSTAETSLVDQLITENFVHKQTMNPNSRVSPDTVVVTRKISGSRIGSMSLFKTQINVQQRNDTSDYKFNQVSMAFYDKSDISNYSYLIPTDSKLKANLEIKLEDLKFSGDQIKPNFEKPFSLHLDNSTIPDSSPDSTRTTTFTQIDHEYLDGKYTTSLQSAYTNLIKVSDSDEITILYGGPISNDPVPLNFGSTSLDILKGFEKTSDLKNFNYIVSDAIKANQKSDTSDYEFITTQRPVQDISDLGNYAYILGEHQKEKEQSLTTYTTTSRKALAEDTASYMRSKNILSVNDIPASYVTTLIQTDKDTSASYSKIAGLELITDAQISYMESKSFESLLEVYSSFDLGNLDNKLDNTINLINIQLVSDVIDAAQTDIFINIVPEIYATESYINSQLNLTVYQNKYLNFDFDAILDSESNIINIELAVINDNNFSLVNIRPQYNIQEQNLLLISPEFEQIIDIRYIASTVEPVTDQVNELTLDLTLKLTQEKYILINGKLERLIDPIYYHPLPPVQQDDEPKLYYPLTPLQDIVPNYIQSLTPILDIPNKFLPPLIAQQYFETKLQIATEYLVDQDIMWIHRDFTKYGAFKTVINVYTDAGRNGDIVTMYGPGTSDELGRLPFVLQSKTYNYTPGGYTSQYTAAIQAGKFTRSLPVEIVGTDFWNYRIYLNTKRYSVPRKGRIFPITWYMRGG